MTARAARFSVGCTILQQPSKGAGGLEVAGWDKHLTSPLSFPLPYRDPLPEQQRPHPKDHTATWAEHLLWEVIAILDTAKPAWVSGDPGYLQYGEA